MTYKDLMIARLTFQQMCEALEEHARKHGIYIVRSYCRRDIEEQKKMVESGASEKLDSRHLYALAQDYNMFDDLEDYEEVGDSGDERWMELGYFWENLGGTWGGSWSSLQDGGHFEWWPFE